MDKSILDTIHESAKELHDAGMMSDMTLPDPFLAFLALKVLPGCPIRLVSAVAAFLGCQAGGKIFLKKIKAPGRYADIRIEREHYGCLGMSGP